MPVMITSFTNSKAWLSNFYGSPFLADGIQYLSVEHFFQASKAKDREGFNWVNRSTSARMAKSRGRRVRIRDDWDEIKLHVMRQGLGHKFALGTPLADKLLKTGDAWLIEGNYWGDKYWGAVFDGANMEPGDEPWKGWSGKNWLGHLLMAQRAFLRSF